MYNGYRVKINGVIVSNDFISQGSYSSQRKEKVLYEYDDANGVRHEVLSPHKPMIITFNIRERNEQEQHQLNGIWQQYENIIVEYWDDVEAVYKMGYFKLDRPVFKHRNTRGGKISYDKTAITLKEY